MPYTVGCKKNIFYSFFNVINLVIARRKSKRKTHNFIRFLHYVRPYTKYIVIAAIGGIVRFTVPLFVPEITRHLLDDVYLNPAMSSPEKLRELYLYIGGMAAVFLFIWSPWTYVRHYYSGKAGHRSVFDLRCDLYYRILRMSASFFDRQKSGGIVARLISDINQAQQLVGSALTNVWMDLAALAVILFFLFRIDVPTALVALSTFPVYLYFFRRPQRQIKASSLQVQQELAALSGNVQEKIAGSKVIHAFTQEKTEQKNFHRDSEKLFSRTMRSVYLQSMNMTITDTLTNLSPLIVALFGGYRVIHGDMSIGELMALGMYLGPLYLPLQRFTELNIVFANSMAALDRIFEIMDEKPGVADAPDAVELGDVQGRVEFRNVSFGYDREDAEEGPVIRNLNLAIQPGQKVALVGPSGSGKSTVVSLIPRFYDVKGGRISIDGQDIRDVTLTSLRRQIGVVLQTPILFSGSVRDNILYGNPRASHEEVVQAARAANALDFIQSLPMGLDTEVGEGGAFLSGGQKQRLTIARAFLKNPRILILDEATSALDSESERLIQEALERLTAGRTTFTIAHRLSTIVNADLILVLDKGRVVESGTHVQLLQRDGIYRNLYRQQFAASLEAADIPRLQARAY
ncbi:MAG: ABC transporter ATP-binding protein [Syntrophotaleaceae bacterium]